MMIPVKSGRQKGASDALFLIVIITLLVLAWLGKSFSPTPNSNRTASGQSFFPSQGGQTPQASKPGQSPWYGQIRIYASNASFEYQPHQEYIVLQAQYGSMREPINITGWTLTNAAGSRRYQLGSNTILGNTSRVTIPSAATLYIPGAPNTAGPVILNPGDRAIVVSGSMPPVTTYPIGSFRVNKCSGYIEEWESVAFSPELQRQCPRPDSYPEYQTVERECYEFLRRLNTCRTPEFKDKKRPDGGYEAGAVDGVVGLSNQCKAFISRTFSYNACVANHLNDENFYTNEWRIFLGQPWELWAQDRETITLYDRQGLIVDQVSY